MTGKEIVLKAMRFEETPRLPVAILDGYVWILRKNNISFRELLEMEDGGAEVVEKAFDDFQSDIVYPNIHAFNFLFEIMGGIVSCDRKGEAFEVTKTPLEEINDFRQYDVDKLCEQLEQKKEYAVGLGLLEKLKKYYGEDKLVCAVSVAPLTLAGMMLGVQNFMMKLYDDEEGTVALLEFATELVVRLCESQIARGADVVFIADPVASGELISPSMFEEYALPYIKEVTGRLKKYDVPIILHICGNTQARLEPLKEAGISAFSLAAVDLKEALETARGHYAIFGNMDPFSVMQAMTSDKVYQTCRELGDIAGLDGGYVMMPGCDLPPAAPLENVQAMVKAAHDKKISV